MASDFRSHASDNDDLLDLEDPESPEELETQVQKARSELEDLRRRQEQIEREKLRLEELSRRQEELEQGRTDICAKLERGVTVLLRESEETRRKLEQFTAIHQAFKQHLGVLEEINPKLWTSSELPKELTKAIGAVDEARSDYAKAQAKIAVEVPESANGLEDVDGGYSEVDVQGFGYWLKAGFAFTLPLQFLGLVGLVVWLISILGKT